MADRDPRVIGARIARRRHQLGWSQVELASRLGVSPSSVANWERGASYPKKKFGKVEQVLRISLDGLAPEAADRSPPTLLDDAVGYEDAELTRRALREVFPAQADEIIAGLERKLRQRAGGAEGGAAAEGGE